MNTKKVVLISDLHCGHRSGLCPPDWQYNPKLEKHIYKKFARIQKESWDRYCQIIKSLGPVYLVCCNGDAIDGSGERSGSTELVCVDRSEQVKMATECLKLWNPKHFCLTRGTPYHVGDKENWEDGVADALGCKIGDHEWAEVGGRGGSCVIDLKHKVGSSQIPHGRYAAIAKEDLWNELWSISGQAPRADIIVRSHVHYHVGGFHYIGGKKRRFLTTPALQSMGTRYGARECSGTVDWGVIAFDINDKGEIVHEYDNIITLETTKAKTTKY